MNILIISIPLNVSFGFLSKSELFTSLLPCLDPAREGHWCDKHTYLLNTSRPRQNWCRFADNIFKCIFLNENVLILHDISLKFVPNIQINNISALVQIMAWLWPGDKPLSEPITVRLLTHICSNKPQWIKPQNTISNDTGYSESLMWVNISNFPNGICLLETTFQEMSQYAIDNKQLQN